MIYNATLNSITSPRVSDGKGGEIAGTTTALSGVRCTVDGPSQSHQRAVMEEQIATEAMLYVELRKLGTTVPQKNGDVTYTIPGLPARTLAIAKVATLVHNGLSHHQLWLYAR